MTQGQYDFLAEDYEDSVENELPEAEETILAPEPLFAAVMRQAVQQVWENDPIMTDFVNYVVQPLSDWLGHESAKGGDFAAEHLAQGKDAARYAADQSMRGHLVNGLLPVLHVGKILTGWQAPQFRLYDDETRRLFMAGYILHDWLKLPQVETALEAAGFSHADSIGPKQMPTVEAIFKEWCALLGLEPFLAPVGGVDKFLHDLIFIASNTQRKWGTLRNLSLLPRLALNPRKRDLCEQLSRLADYLVYIARTPREVATNTSLHREISTLSNLTAVFTCHHLADNRGLLTNFIHNSVLDSLRSEERVPVLYAPSGVVYLTRKDASLPPPVSDVVEMVIEKIKNRVGATLAQSLDGFTRANIGLKYADYYWLFFDASQMIELGARAAFKIIHENKKPVSGSRYAKMMSGQWLPESVSLDLPDDRRVDQLAEWAYFTEKLTAAQFKGFDTPTFLLEQMGLTGLKSDFEAVPRDNRAGGVGYHWYFAAGHYLKQHSGLDPTVWQERVQGFAANLRRALPQHQTNTTEPDRWVDLRAYIKANLTFGGETVMPDPRQAVVIELNRYENAKRKGRGKTAICSICSAAFEVNKQQEAAVLFAPQVYSNKLSLHGSDATRNICAICSLEMMLRQLFMNKTSASGGNFEGRRMRYLFFYPTYFFTPETLVMVKLISNRLKNASFTELRKVLIKGNGLDANLNVTSQTLQRLENLVLVGPDEAPPRAWMRFTDEEPSTFTFIGVPPPGRDAKDAEAWVHPAFLALLLPLCLDVKIVATESPVPLLLEADELPETVFIDGAHAFVGHLLRQERINIDQLLPAIQRLIAAYLIQLDANSGMGRGGFDYRWQDIPAVARNLAASPLYAFHYLKKWQRKQNLDTLPVGKAHLYQIFVDNYLSERSNSMSHARELTTLYRQFYRAKRRNSNSILRPLSIGAKTLLGADQRLFDNPEALEEVVFGELQRRVNKLQKDNLAFFPKGSSYESRETAMRQFANYLVNQIFYGAFRGDVSALQGKQLNLLSSACEAIYRTESAKDNAETADVEDSEE